MKKNVEKQLTIEYKTIRKDLKEISKKSGIKYKELLKIAQLRESIQLNRELRHIHEHLDVHMPIKKGETKQ